MRREVTRPKLLEPFRGGRASLSSTAGEAAGVEVLVPLGHHGGVCSRLVERTSVHNVDGLRHYRSYQNLLREI